MSYHFGNLQWAIAHVLALFGAYFAGVLIYASAAENNNTGATRNRTWLVSSALLSLSQPVCCNGAALAPCYFHVADSALVIAESAPAYVMLKGTRPPFPLSA